MERRRPRAGRWRLLPVYASCVQGCFFVLVWFKRHKKSSTTRWRLPVDMRDRNKARRRWVCLWAPITLEQCLRASKAKAHTQAASSGISETMLLEGGHWAWKAGSSAVGQAGRRQRPSCSGTSLPKLMSRTSVINDLLDVPQGYNAGYTAGGAGLVALCSRACRDRLFLLAAACHVPFLAYGRQPGSAAAHVARASLR
jgi:hypothetical protein